MERLASRAGYQEEINPTLSEVVMKTMRSISKFIGAALLAAFAAVPAQAREVSLDVALGTPVIEAGRTQKAFLKVSITGFEVDRPSERPPVNAAIVLDKSGSMAGEKIMRAREAAIMALDLLGEGDIVSVVTYDGTVRVVVPATEVSRRYWIADAIRTINAGGSTALFAGVSKGAGEVRKYLARHRVNRVILLSDGLANVGPSTPVELGRLGSALGTEGISVTTIGLGLGYNEDLMTQLAGYSDGNHAFVEHPGDLARIFENEFQTAKNVIAKDLDIVIHCERGIRPIRVLGRDSDIAGQVVRTRMNQLSSRQEKFVVLEVEIPAGDAGASQKLASVGLSYINLITKKSSNLKNSVSVSYTRNEKEVKAKANKAVMKSSIEQVANEMSKDAVRLRDQGRVGEAQELLKEGAKHIEEEFGAYAPAPAMEMKQEMRRDADELDEAEWNKKRKSLRERQFKLDNQQQY